MMSNPRLDDPFCMPVAAGWESETEKSAYTRRLQDPLAQNAIGSLKNTNLHEMLFAALNQIYLYDQAERREIYQVAIIGVWHTEFSTF